LGTTFGGNHLACAASIAVLDVLRDESLIDNAAKTGSYLIEKIKEISPGMKIRGRGLMIGLEFDTPVKEMRERLLHRNFIFTGFSGQNIIRLLPPLCLSEEEAGIFLEACADLF
jgi:acetylornithine/N-succinyldiaminopimelate aminotransferase